MYHGLMRTTIELKPEHSAKLLELAARRGEKGFSSVIAEAIDTYLGDRTKKEFARRRVLKLRGALSNAEGERPSGISRPCVDRAAEIRRSLERSGTAIGMADTLIAGIVLVHSGTLLTRNRRHFEHVAGLRIAAVSAQPDTKDR
jgi:predicted nucleic acid-binding protein